MKAKVIQVKKTLYGGHKLTIEYGTGYYAANEKHANPCKERKFKPLEKGAEITKKFEVLLNGDEYLNYINNQKLVFELGESV